MITTGVFSETYAEGRSRFRAASSAAGALLSDFAHPRSVAPDGESLTMDVARFGAAEAERMLVVLCGVHGLEASAGAATMLQWLARKGPEKLGRGVGVLLVHGVNPYGWAHASRGNEDNIDLNRNFLRADQTRPENEGYRELHDMIVGTGAAGSAQGFDQAVEQFHVFRLRHGVRAALQAVTAGQYDIPAGLSYGGHATSWSNSTVLDVVGAACAGATKTVILDWHTGIGAFGAPYFVTLDSPDSPSFARAREWWGAQYINGPDAFDGAKIPAYTGILIEAVQARVRESSGGETLGIGVEFGTYGIELMIQALVMDNWLRFAGAAADARTRAGVRARLIERFCPSAPEWRSAALGHAARIYDQALTGLANW
jgi:Protein of unknown function (DUF2817)